MGYLDPSGKSGETQGSTGAHTDDGIQEGYRHNTLCTLWGPLGPSPDCMPCNVTLLSIQSSLFYYMIHRSLGINTDRFLAISQWARRRNLFKKYSLRLIGIGGLLKTVAQVLTLLPYEPLVEQAKVERLRHEPEAFLYTSWFGPEYRPLNDFQRAFRLNSYLSMEQSPGFLNEAAVTQLQVRYNDQAVLNRDRMKTFVSSTATTQDIVNDINFAASSRWSPEKPTQGSWGGYDSLLERITGRKWSSAPEDGYMEVEIPAYALKILQENRLVHPGAKFISLSHSTGGKIWQIFNPWNLLDRSPYEIRYIPQWRSPEDIQLPDVVMPDPRLSSQLPVDVSGLSPFDTDVPQ